MKMKRVREFFREFFHRFSKDHVIDNASAAAFWLFLSLLPLVAVMAMLAVKLTNLSALDLFESSIPASAREFVTSELHALDAWNGGTVAPLSALVFLWLASSGIHGILDAFDATAEVTHPWWRKRLLACGMCIGISILVAATGFVLDIGHAWLTPIVRSPARYVLAFAGQLGLIAALFRVGLPPHMRRWPGALVAASLQTVLGFGYVLWVRTLGGAGAYSAASLAAIGATMTAMFLFTLSLLAGVTFNVTIAKLRKSTLASGPPAAARPSVHAISR